MQEVFDKIIKFIHSEIERTESWAEHDTLINVEFFVEELKEKYNNGWIACSERLPSEKEAWNYNEEEDLYEPNEFIVMIKGATLPTVLFYGGISNEWRDGNNNVYEVIAWQLLPAPYKKEV